jgi:hypothetical protein
MAGCTALLAGAVVLAGMAPPIGGAGWPDEGAGAGPDGGGRTTPGMFCAMARCCCNGMMLGKIANSSIAPILKTMPKEAWDTIPQYRECHVYKELC